MKWEFEVFRKCVLLDLFNSFSSVVGFLNKHKLAQKGAKKLPVRQHAAVFPNTITELKCEVYSQFWIKPAMACRGAALRPLLGSSQIHCSQQRPGIFTRCGVGHHTLGGWDSLHSGMQPMAPFTHRHWYLQFGWKLCPVWYITPLCSQPVPRRSVHRQRSVYEFVIRWSFCIR